MPILAIANRKGGVGKSTVATMIAYGLTLWAKQRVLLIDLDSQCNASLILFGGQNWKLAREKGQTIADYFSARFDRSDIDFKDYLFHEVGDVTNGTAKAPQISLVPGSVGMEDIEHELLYRMTQKTTHLLEAEEAVVARMSVMLKSLKRHYPMVIFDCPPGLSFATSAALQIADKVIVPFRPDFVSQYAVDRISRIIEKKPDLPSVIAIPQKDRRYVALANFVSDDIGGLERIEDIEDYHPLMKTRILMDGQIANAFNWRGTRIPIEAKFGAAGTRSAQALVEEVKSLLALR
jgi:chromosome partitioning protein